MFIDVSSYQKCRLSKYTYIAIAPDRGFIYVAIMLLNAFVTFSVKTIPFGTFGLSRNTILKH